MLKTITIENKDVQLDNNMGWAMEYRNQFGRDILPVFMPILIGGIDIVKEMIESIDDASNITKEDLLSIADSDALIEAIIHLSSLEVVDVINITWAMAKAADSSIPEPERWIRGFERFPLDIVAPEIVGLVLDGMVSSKNLKWLKEMIGTLRPSLTSTTLFSPVSSEG